MRTSGRASLVAILGVVAAAAIIGLLVFARESVGSIGGRFMSALAKGDAETLAELSHMEGLNEEQRQQAWKETVAAGKYYVFRWRVANWSQPSADTASVTVMVERNLLSGSSYEEKFQLPMVRKDGEWLVDAYRITRGMYPALPRAGSVGAS